MGPLSGIRIVELAGIGPGPMCAMLLADLGAEVIRIDRTSPAELGVPRPLKYNLTLRNRKTIALDLKSEPGKRDALRLIKCADALIEGFRPGVAERLGLGPDDCLKINPRLVYGRVTGWGQTGPLASAAGHDLNYIALTGALHSIGREGAPPTPPLNLLGDFGGGSLYLAVGILSALIERQRSGLGQVVDAAIVDGAASLMTQFYGMAAAGLWSAQRGMNVLDSGAPFYDVYECADGHYVSVAPIEAKFLEQLIEILGLPPVCAESAKDRKQWPHLRKALADEFKKEPRTHWCSLLRGSDACFAPVLSIDEAPHDEHLRARGTFVTVDDIVQPAPAPQFSRTRPADPTPPQPSQSMTDCELASTWLSSE